ncbi:hypothetical protein BDF21DRAFT_396946 [Thamnidium elegans]|nr:hypothetical protein BDF21DRAFT_396946 [Thamnidium elegans]
MIKPILFVSIRRTIPRLLIKLSLYQKIIQELIRMLSQDFRLVPEKMDIVLQLFAGSIIHGRLALIALTVEVDARYVTLDIHLETNADSIPCSDCHYKGLFCEITSDGNNPVIGSHSANLSLLPPPFHVKIFSSYLYWRATLNDMNNKKIMPSTIFSLCDTANRDGYGSNHNFLPKVSSLLVTRAAIVSYKGFLGTTKYPVIPKN